MAEPDLLVLDFDGVICDGLREYWQTAWRAYARCWGVDEDETVEPMGLEDRFRKLRPVIETGWEMPVLVAALVQGVGDAEILENWPILVRQIAEAAQKQPQELVAQVDGERDRQIQTQLEAWLALHHFYPGVLDLISRVQRSATQLYIVSTKEGRFIRQLLAQGGVELAPEQIIGKEIRQPKYQTLRDLQGNFNRNLISHPQGQAAAQPSLWFIEDRLPALQAVQVQADLQEVRLFLADWGYNVAPDRQAAAADEQIELLDLETFCGWPFPERGVSDAGSD
ncbi:MAG: HAD family hydrolase [Synechococcales cyanobacterium RU_4_20]|nr:HAD family hydrolase [Synechococcales cyanobacterium RU_4_20]NJR67587.1 HAD family hydrolase [Synechococcales cyanobacterium CRU_2_2]